MNISVSEFRSVLFGGGIKSYKNIIKQIIGTTALQDGDKSFYYAAYVSGSFLDIVGYEPCSQVWHENVMVTDFSYQDSISMYLCHNAFKGWVLIDKEIECQ